MLSDERGEARVSGIRWNDEAGALRLLVVAVRGESRAEAAIPVEISATLQAPKVSPARGPSSSRKWLILAGVAVGAVAGMAVARGGLRVFVEFDVHCASCSGGADDWRADDRHREALMRRAILLVSMLATTLAAQTATGGLEAVRSGVFRDREGNLRSLRGVPGAWVARLEGAGQVISAGSSERAHFYKTETTLTVVDGQGRERSFEAPPGPVLGSFDVTGEPFAFYFVSTGQVARWVAGEVRFEELATLGNPVALGPAWAGADDIVFADAAGGAAIVSPSGEIVTPPVAVDGIEHLGGGWYLLRSAAGLWAWRPGEEMVAVPLAEAPAFQLFERDGAGAETAVGATFNMPPAVVGDASTASFRIRNNGVAAVTISRLSIDLLPVDGTPTRVFALFNQFYPPRVIAAGGFADFSISFTPPASGSFTSTLWINDLQVKLQAQTRAAPVVEWSDGSTWTTLSMAAANNMGSIDRGSALERRLRITPADPAASLSGSSAFSLTAGATAGEYTLQFLSSTAGTFQTTLNLTGLHFTITATANALAAPAPLITPASGNLSSARQVKLAVNLQSPALYDTVGMLTLQFMPLLSTLEDDSAIALLPKLVRQISFRVVKGATAVDFGEDVYLQTGATAGTISLSAQIGANTARTAYRIEAAPVAVSAAKFSAVTGLAEVLLTALDNTHTVSKVAFTFYLTSGQTAQPGRVESDVSAAFRDFFMASKGGSFTLRATFPVSGTVSELASVDVALTSTAGTTTVNRVSLQ